MTADTQPFLNASILYCASKLDISDNSIIKMRKVISRMETQSVINVLTRLPFIAYASTILSLFGTRWLNTKYTQRFADEDFNFMFHDAICRLGSQDSHRTFHAFFMSLTALLIMLMASLKAWLLHRLIPSHSKKTKRVQRMYIVSCICLVIVSWKAIDLFPWVVSGLIIAQGFDAHHWMMVLRHQQSYRYSVSRRDVLKGMIFQRLPYFSGFFFFIYLISGIMRKMEPWHESSAVYESEWIGFLFICISMYAFVIQGKFIKKRMKEKYSEVEDAEDPMVLL